jgi:hypothetical protein
MSSRERWLTLSAVLMLLPAVAPAQTFGPRFEMSGGILYVRGQDLADPDANLTRNQVGGEPYTLFESESRLESAPALEARVGWRLTRRMTIEGGVLASRPRLTASVRSDVEGAPDATLEEDLSMYIFDGAVAFQVAEPRGRVVPFVRGGIGYLRELHEENALVETGLAYHAGGGVNLWFGERRRTGLRLDARLLFLDGGVDLGKDTRTLAAGGASIVFSF